MHEHRLKKLADQLADSGAKTGADSLDDQARGAFLILIRAAKDCRTFPEPLPTDPLKCPNCGADASSPRSPYCSDDCRCEAAFVRQTRAAIAEGTVLAHDRQVALGENFWRLLGGLYPRRQAMVLDRVKKRVMRRTEGACEVCGKPATTVDHIGSG